jgi:hypothetical protein
MAIMALTLLSATALADHDVEIPIAGTAGTEYEDLKGTGNIFDNGDGTSKVVITLNGVDGPSPAHFHEPGDCGANNPIAIPLEPVVDGTSTTMVDESVEALLESGYYLNVHLSDKEIATVIACGDNFATLAYEGDEDYDGGEMAEMPDTGAGGMGESSNNAAPMAAVGLVLAGGLVVLQRKLGAR